MRLSQDSNFVIGSRCPSCSTSDPALPIVGSSKKFICPKCQTILHWVQVHEEGTAFNIRAASEEIRTIGHRKMAWTATRKKLVRSDVGKQKREWLEQSYALRPTPWMLPG